MALYLSLALLRDQARAITYGGDRLSACADSRTRRPRFRRRG